MKKENLYTFLFAVSALLAVGFCVRLWADYIQHSTTLNSAPFSVFILVRAVEFLLPATVLLIAGLILKRRSDKQAKT